MLSMNMLKQTNDSINKVFNTGQRSIINGSREKNVAPEKVSELPYKQILRM